MAVVQMSCWNGWRVHSVRSAAPWRGWQINSDLAKHLWELWPTARLCTVELPSSLRATAKDAIRKVLLEMKSASEKFIFNFQQQTKSWNIKSVWCVRLHQLHFRGGAPRRFAFGSFWAADSGRAIHTEHIVVIFSGGRMMWVHCGHWPLPRKTDDPVTTGFSPAANRSSPWCRRFCGYCSAVGIEKISALGNPWCCWSAGWRHGEVIGECCQNGGFLSLCLQKLSNMFSENTVLHHSSEFLAIWFRRLLLVEVLVQALRQLYTFFRSVFNPIQLEMESRYQWTLY